MTPYNRAARYSLSNYPLEESSASSRDSFVTAKQNPLILSIDTATRSGSVALVRGETVLAVSMTESSASSHSQLLLHSVQEVLGESGVALSEIEFFAAASGPGSFTGLRIGLATVKAFAATMNRSCAGIPTLHAVAHAGGESLRTLALLPGGRGEVFAQLLKVGQSGAVHELEPPVHLTPQKLLEKVKNMTPIKWVGEGAHVYGDTIAARALSHGIALRHETESDGDAASGEQGWTIVRKQSGLARDVAELALLRFRSAEVETPDQLRAIYVRPSDADLNAQCQE